MSYAGATADASGLVRVTVASTRGRADLSVPAFVPVAELVPGLASRTGVLDPATASGGLRLVGVDGRELAPTHGLADQGVADGALLTIVADVAQSARVHDDIVDAVAEAVDREFTPLRLPRALVLAMGVGCLGLAAAGPMFSIVRTTAGSASAALMTALVILVAAANHLPGLVIGMTCTRAQPLHSLASLTSTREPIDTAAVSRDVRLAHRVLLGSMAASGLLLVIVAPFAVADGVTGTGLVVASAAVIGLRSRRFRSGAEALTGVGFGLAGLAVAAASALALQPGWQPVLTAALFSCGVSAAGLALSPWRPWAFLSWMGDVVEFVALAALLPLLLIATGVVARVGG